MRMEVQSMDYIAHFFIPVILSSDFRYRWRGRVRGLQVTVSQNSFTPGCSQRRKMSFFVLGQTEMFVSGRPGYESVLPQM